MSKRAKRPPYSRERKAEALALARIAGAEVASERTHIPVQTVRRWMDAAGIQPGAELPQDRLEALRDLAEASVTADLVAGRIREVQAMTVAGIARRHIAKPAPQLDASAVSVRDTFVDWIVDTVPAESLDSEEALTATAAAIDDVRTMLLLRRANAETPYGPENSPHRRALLAWFSGREEIPAGDILDWSKAQVLEVLETHGSLAAWHAAALADEAAEEAQRKTIAAESRAKAEAARASARTSSLDRETRELLAAAEAFLRSGSDA